MEDKNWETRQQAPTERWTEFPDRAIGLFHVLPLPPFPAIPFWNRNCGFAETLVPWGCPTQYVAQHGFKSLSHTQAAAFTGQVHSCSDLRLREKVV